MATQSELLREFFEFDVTINGDLAKWENHKHPENPNFQQIVNWAAWEAHGHLTVCYYLDKTNIGGNTIHANIPMNSRTFEEAVFEYWSTN